MRDTGPPTFTAYGGPTFIGCSSPADPLEERIDLTRCPIGILALWGMSDPFEHPQVKIRKRLAQAIGPRIGKQRIVLGPADAGRHLDRRKPQSLAHHHLHAPRMGCTIMREAAGEVARLEEVVAEGFQHIVEGVLAMRPV